AVTWERSGHLRDMKPGELGGSTEKYSWKQTNWEVWCHVPVPPEATRNDIRCSIRRKQFSLFVFDEEIMDGTLFDNVDQEESSWTLDVLDRGMPPRQEVNITFVKEMETQGRNHWPTIVLGEPEINVRWLGPPIKVIHPQDRETLHLMAGTLSDKERPFCNMRDPLATPGK
ncbi:unnamed protein product, partial [Polarella glacialis]